MYNKPTWTDVQKQHWLKDSCLAEKLIQIDEYFTANENFILLYINTFHR